MRALIAIAALGLVAMHFAIREPVGQVIPVPDFCEHGPCPRSAAAAQPSLPTSNGTISASAGSSPAAEPLPGDADSCCGPTWECEFCEVGK